MIPKRYVAWQFICLLAMTCFLPFGAFNAAYSQTGEPDNLVSLKNDHFQVAFDRTTGELKKMVFLPERVSFLAETASQGSSPWEITIAGGNQPSRVNIQSATRFVYHHTENQLELKWSDFPELPKGFTVTAYVGLLPDSAMSTWRIEIDGIHGKRISKVTFPRLAGLTDLGDEELVAPDWMGSLLQSPRKELSASGGTQKRFAWSYPGHMSMQFLALYNPHRAGLYLACDDTAAYNKEFSLSMDSAEQLSYSVDHFPPFDDQQETYRPDYSFIIGAFKGDWLTAAQLYKGWAERQPWCLNSRLKNRLVPAWVENTGYWVWNRGRGAHVLPPAAALSRRLGLPVNVLWHWWHGGSYDDSFPEYFPPRDGKQQFISELRNAQQQGVHALVYMNALKWGPSTQSWKDEHAERYAGKDIHGHALSHVYNIFTKKALTNMCEATDFWKNKYASLVDTAVNQYGVDGVYMDQACQSRMCYDPAHGHPIGGGNYWVQHFARKDQLIRASFPQGGNQVLAGEGVGENWLPFLDVFLALQVSKERYAGIHSWQTVPLFQAVYHEYAITFGNYSSLMTPPYDELWPREFAPADAETPLDPVFNRQFLMEQARSFAWGMQPMIANYQPSLDSARETEIGYILRLGKVRQAGLKYFVHGEFKRPPMIAIPEETISISKLSIYAGHNEKVTRFEKSYPTAYTSAWKSRDGSLAVAIASISRQHLPVDFMMNTADYGLESAGEIYVYDETGMTKLGDYRDGTSKVRFTLPPRGICFIEFIPSL
ncbi:hypothetical protein JHJ32_00935 [Parapedobacter sp. ISTM3]|uniref:DUF6259 domain-containing protein n=1 Tax=Parapedobacter sp. ISTM3 TaxID=2800130 RepID=UPI0019078B35|nr:DUF6259 domain-containing protein [Parapedobacter sp. ISTM3]MBK1438538.1 hypothetical protein [Parapedobacter sp. ISTM3]